MILEQMRKYQCWRPSGGLARDTGPGGKGEGCQSEHRDNRDDYAAHISTSARCETQGRLQPIIAMR
jgi:hypothetical protein